MVMACSKRIKRLWMFFHCRIIPDDGQTQREIEA
jgi:hypothetical protein